MTRCASPRLILYAGLAAVGLLGALASGRAEPVVLAAPFAVLVAVAMLSSPSEPAATIPASPGKQTSIPRTHERGACATAGAG